MATLLSRFHVHIRRNWRYCSTFAQFHAVPKVQGNGYTLFEVGTPNTTNYRAYLVGEQGLVSPFHDVPLVANRGAHEFNMVVEIPRWSNAKFEICKEERLNPLKQDVKKGKLRFVQNVHPYHGYIWNYGALPQTWEDPEHVDPHTSAKGDNDPLDVCEIGSRVHRRGAVVRVKPLGVLGLIDEGESDWKMIVIDVSDPMASKLNDISDVDRQCPGLLADTLRWFRLYKVPGGKAANRFAFDGKFRDADFASQLIEQTNGFWKRLQGKNNATVDGIALASRTGANRITEAQACELLRVGTSDTELKSAAPLPQDIDKTYYIQNDEVANK